MRFLAVALMALAASMFAFGFAFGCAKKERAPANKDDGPAPISVKEQKRGAEACADFKKRVCACAGEHPDNEKLATDCQLADSRIQALDLSARISATENSSAADRTAAVNNGRRIIKKCIERTAQLAVNCGLTKTPAAPEEPPANSL